MLWTLLIIFNTWWNNHFKAQFMHGLMSSRRYQSRPLNLKWLKYDDVKLTLNLLLAIAESMKMVNPVVGWRNIKACRQFGNLSHNTMWCQGSTCSTTHFSYDNCGWYTHNLGRKGLDMHTFVQHTSWSTQHTLCVCEKCLHIMSDVTTPVHLCCPHLMGSTLACQCMCHIMTSKLIITELYVSLPLPLSIAHLFVYHRVQLGEARCSFMHHIHAHACVHLHTRLHTHVHTAHSRACMRSLARTFAHACAWHTVRMCTLTHVYICVFAQTRFLEPCASLTLFGT